MWWFGVVTTWWSIFVLGGWLRSSVVVTFLVINITFCWNGSHWNVKILYLGWCGRCWNVWYVLDHYVDVEQIVICWWIDFLALLYIAFVFVMYVVDMVVSLVLLGLFSFFSILFINRVCFVWGLIFIFFFIFCVQG